MKGIGDELASPTHKERRATHPKGWEPGYEQAGDSAVGTAQFEDGADPSSDELVAGFGLHPDEWAVVGAVNCRRWQTYDGRWLRYFKCDLVRRTRGDRADVDALCAAAMRRRVKAPPARTDDGWVSFVSLNDWQIGKGEGGGTAATVEWLRERFAMLDDLWRKDRPAEIHLGSTGDLSEGVTGHYASQAFTVDLDQREQDRVARRLLLALLDIAARRAPLVTVSGVPCNHGQNRNGAGKMHTTVSDNKTLTYVENVQEVAAANPDAYGHVRFLYPPDETLVADMAGVPVALNHGHSFGGGGALVAADKWWTGQIKGMLPAAGAVMLLTAHRHHLTVSEESGRTIMLAPACDGGSGWYTRTTGASSPRGLLTVKVGAGIGNPLEGERCWDDLTIL